MPLLVPDSIAFDAAGLVPVIVQDYASGDVLMLGWANAEALARTAETSLAHFWSRSRGALWKKGETSGHTMRVREVRADCDRDALLMIVDPEGPACHEGTRSCFGETAPTAIGVLDELVRVVDDRAQRRPERSYTARLLARGLDHALKKVGEEATEVVIAAKGQESERVAEETADLVFHLLVVLNARGVPFADVLRVLRQRRSGA
jgi:phosphoribosyl-ATP pyrophosphohydrolase/phosphoribosyl-AMP cyclohydrolase